MKYYIAIIILIGLSVVWLSMPKIDDKEMFMPKEPQSPHLPYHSNASTEIMIRQMADFYGVVPDKAINIAWCESKLGKYEYNFTGSSAKGLYQFIDKTWENYCNGDVLNEVDNARCFMKLYNKYPHWWECKG